MSDPTKSESAKSDAEKSYSPGLEGIVAGETAISTLATGLSYRGYDIEDLTAHSTYDESAYLVLHGELPTASQAAGFHDRVVSAMTLPREAIEVLKRIPKTADAMDVMRTACSFLAHFDLEVDQGGHNANIAKAERLLGKMAAILGAWKRILDGKEPVPGDHRLGFAANVLWMLRGETPTAEAAKAMDITLILYAEHEFNASTFAARCIASTLSDLHSAITGAIGTLKGPLHGGANERALEVLLAAGSPAQAEKWIRDALARKERIMGFGHRVYKTGDPRAVFLKKLCGPLAKETGHEDLEAAAEIIEKVVTTEKKLPPNVDWPCARLYHYLGIAKELFTPLFVVARVVGWSAHVVEQLDNNRLMRPRSIYTGPEIRRWKPATER